MGLGLVNDNKALVDRYLFEQCAFAPASGISGTCIEDDGVRYIYVYFQTSATAAAFARYDTWGDGWQTLTIPATQTGSIAKLIYTSGMGGQYSGQIFGSLYLFVGNGTICYWYKYDIATNTWSANLGTTNVPNAFGTDCYICYPQPSSNNYETTYHAGVTRTITTTAIAAAGATSITVSTLPEPLAVGTVLKFSSYNMTITAAAAKGTTTLTVSGSTEAMKAGTVLFTNDGREFCLDENSLAGAATLTVKPLIRDILASSVVKIEKTAVLTAAALLSATTLTVAALIVGIPSASAAPYYGNMYLIGNNATVMYRYNLGAAAWATTSANSGNPAIPAVPATVGGGCGLKWMPAYEPNKLYCVRGNASSNMYTYDLVNNVWATVTYYPSTETFTTGTSVSVRASGSKNGSLIIKSTTNNKFFEYIPYKGIMDVKLTNQQMVEGTAVAGDKMSIIKSPDGIDYLFVLGASTNALIRCPLIDS